MEWKDLLESSKQYGKIKKGICPICHEPIDIEERDIILKIPKTKGGTESVTNMNYVHKNCKIMYQSCCAKALWNAWAVWLETFTYGS